MNKIGIMKETLRIETGHMTEVEVGIEITDENLAGIKETRM